MIGDEIRSLIPWSRIFDNKEIVLALNTDYATSRTNWVIVDRDLHKKGDLFTCLYSTDPAQITRQMIVDTVNGDTRVVNLTVPAAGLVIYR
jgi:hypothetical protein